jgi:hypothetical protein
LAEIFRNLEKGPKVPRGFYVIGMKKDQRTGAYVGVATWMTKDVPLGGVRIKPSSRTVKEVPGQTTLETIKSLDETYKLANSSYEFAESKEVTSDQDLHEPHPELSSVLGSKVSEPTKSSVTAQQMKAHEDKPVEQAGRKSSYVDPYDSYLL